MPILDPFLEAQRGSSLDEEARKRANQGKEADLLAAALDRVHASFLFLRKHEIGVQQFCRHLDATPANILNNSWNALVAELGLDYKIIGCLQNMREVSYTELILRSYASIPDASLGNLIRAVKKIDRLDAFVALRKTVEDVSEQCRELGQNEDSGFSSLDTESGTEHRIRMIYPNSATIQHQWKKGLPFTLRHLEGGEDRQGEEEGEEGVKIQELPRVRHREENRVQGAAVMPMNSIPRATTSREEPACKVFLTFAEDGKSLANEIATKLRTRNGNRPPIGVLTLDRHWDMVERNPENFIMHWFEKANYIIPIVTKGYMKAIRKKCTHETENELDGPSRSLDVQYVPFIKDLANKYYTANFCKNYKIRCIVPFDKRSILHQSQCKFDPVMKSYVYDNEIEGLAKRMTKTFDSEED